MYVLDVENHEKLVYQMDFYNGVFAHEYMIEIYAKRQRAKRKDPQQEAIVAEKDMINERTKALIDLIISMKKGWNGGPSPNIGVEKFNLTQPIPDVVIGTGDVVIRDLSEIVQVLRNIKTMQDSYSAARAQRSEKMKEVQVPSISTVPNVQQVASAAVEDELRKMASNPFSRVLTYISAYNPFVKEKNRGQRLSLLQSLARIDNTLLDIEDNILSSDDGAILNSIYHAKMLYSDSKSSFFVSFRKNIEQILVNTDRELEQLKQVVKTQKTDGLPLTDKDNQVLVNINMMQQTAQPAVVETKHVTENSTESLEPPLSDTPVTLTNETNVTEKPIEKETIPESVVKKNKKKKKKHPIAPLLPKSDFIDSDSEAEAAQEQLLKYKEIVNFLRTNVNRYFGEAEDIVEKLTGKWFEEANKELQKALVFGNDVIFNSHYGKHYEREYGYFLFSIGIIKSMEYIYSVEAEEINRSPEKINGFMLNESELKSQAENFAKSEYAKYHSILTSKIATAGNITTRFIKRMLTHIIPRRDRSLRLTISRNVRQARRGLQVMMNILEDRNLDFGNLISRSEQFLEFLKNIYEGIADLGDMYNSTMRMEKSYRKQHGSKMTYDLIPTIDINSLRIIYRQITNDITNVQKLQELEQQVMEASKALESSNE